MPTLDEQLVAIGDSLERGTRRAVAERRTRRRVARTGLIAAIALVGTLGSAVAASSLLGGPAPAVVQAAIDRFYPQGGHDSLAPAPGGARAVATFGSDVLYRLPARDGTSVCLVIVLAHPANGQAIPGEGCIVPLGAAGGWLPIGILSIGSGDDRQLVYGEIDARAGSELWLEPKGEAPQRVVLGADGFFLVERAVQPPSDDPANQPYVPARLVLRGANGDELATRAVSFLLPGHELSP
jgi:hypothetical protein